MVEARSHFFAAKAEPQIYFAAMPFARFAERGQTLIAALRMPVQAAAAAYAADRAYIYFRRRLIGFGVKIFANLRF